MKRNIIFLGALLISVAFFFSSYQTGTYSSQGNRTGSNGNTTGCATCHGSASSATFVKVVLKNAGSVVTEYVPGLIYDVVIDGSNNGSSHPMFGFQLTCNKVGTSGTSVGTFGTNGNTSVATKANGTFLEHKTPLNATTSGSANTYVQTFKWTAPAAGTGTVKFYMVLNAVNGNGNDDTGDQWNFGTSGDITEAIPSSIDRVNERNKLVISPNPSKGAILLSLKEGTSGTVFVRITDLLGKTVFTQEHFVAAGTSFLTCDLSNLANGNYLITLLTSKEQVSGKVLLQ